MIADLSTLMAPAIVPDGRFVYRVPMVSGGGSSPGGAPGLHILISPYRAVSGCPEQSGKQPFSRVSLTGPCWPGLVDIVQFVTFL